MSQSSPPLASSTEVLDRYTFVVEPGKVVEFARAVGDDNPEPQVPVTFPAAAAFQTREATELLTSLGIDVDRALHGEEQYTYWRPLEPGMRLEATTRLIDQDERMGTRGGTIRRFRFETSFADEAGHPVVVVRRTVLETSTPFQMHS